MSDTTDVLHAASIGADLQALLHRGNESQVTAAIDLLKSLASDVATIAALVPGGAGVAAVAASVTAVAGTAENAFAAPPSVAVAATPTQR